MTEQYKALAQTLYEVLRQKGFEVVTANIAPNQLRVVGRVQKVNIPTWLNVMERLLVVASGSPWNVDLSKQYLMRGQKLLYGWRIILQAEQMEVHLQDITSTVGSSPVARRQLDEVALTAGPNRNALHMGKGAQPTTKAVVGPMALRTLNTGG